MKPRLLLWLPFVFLIALLWAGCDRFQYREQYVGDYDFSTIKTFPDSLNPDSTTTPYLGYVDLYDDELVVIRFLANDSIAPKVAKDGGLEIEGFVAAGGTFSGSFSDADHVAFTAEFVNYLHEKVRYVVTGTKR